MIPTDQNRVHLGRTQVFVAVSIVLGFYGMAIAAAFFKVEIDPGMLETSKNVMLMLVGYLFRAGVENLNVRKDTTIAATAAAAPAGPPAFPDTQPQKDRP